MTEPGTSFRDLEHRGWSAEDAGAGYHDHFSPIATQAVGAVLDAAGVGPGTRVVDVGTDAGYAAAAAAGRGALVVGVDFSAAQLARARRDHPTLEFRAGDAGALPFPDGSVDAVLSNFGMPHFPDPDAFLRDAFRILRQTPEALAAIRDAIRRAATAHARDGVIELMIPAVAAGAEIR